jgi:hypothetical protein
MCAMQLISRRQIQEAGKEVKNLGLEKEVKELLQESNVIKRQLKGSSRRKIFLLSSDVSKQEIFMEIT